MKCSDVRSVLDEHRLSALSPAARLKFDAHLADCGSCFAEVSAQRLLTGEPAEALPEGLLEAVVARASAAEPSRRRSPEHFRWQSTGTLAALAALLLVVVVIATRGPSGLPDDLDRGGATSDVSDSVPSLAQAFVEGEHFLALPAAGRFSDFGDRITTWIYFMWSCLHCYELESMLSEWVARQDPAAVDVVKVPVVWNDYAELHARAFYTASLLDISGPVSDAFFESIHQRSEYLDTRTAIRSLFLDLGVDAALFDRTFDSDRTDDLLNLARFSAAEAQIDATPTLIIGGVYKTSPAMAGSQERMLEVADWLMAALRSNATQTPRCLIDRDAVADCE